MFANELAELKALARKCARLPTWSLADDALVDCLDSIQQIAAAIAGVQLHLIREIDGRGLPIAQHASSTAVWLREHSRIGITTAKRMVDLAAVVDQRPTLDAAPAATSTTTGRDVRFCRPPSGEMGQAG